MNGTRTESNEGFHWWGAALLFAALATWAAPPTLGAAALVAEVREPFEVNGEIYPASRVSLREVTALSPVASLHEIRVDGHSHGLVLVRSDGEAVSSRSELGFTRAADGHLVLASVALAGAPEGTVDAPNY